MKEHWTKIVMLIRKNLMDKQKTICTLESMTGGKLASVLSCLPGSSKYFSGGIITYNNQTKQYILCVGVDTLKQYGAVSAQTGIEMAHGGVQYFSNTNYFVSITGIAGPETDEFNTPVGTVYITIYDNITGNMDQRKLLYLNPNFTREEIIDNTITETLNFINSFISKN